MARFKYYASALVSSYCALAANVAYTLASVPLALNYLSNEEFALWGLSIQIASYVALIDFGMAGVSRILVDYKDRKQESGYGSVIQTSLIVSGIQSVIILGLSGAVALSLAALLRVPSALSREFVVLVIAQCALLAGTFITRIFSYILAAHQRHDLMNYAQIAVFLGSFISLWISFRLGSGVFGVIWAQFVGWFLSTTVSYASCVKLKLFPPAGRWGRPSWQHGKELFTYGRDIFLFVLGGQLVSASHMIVISRQLDLTAVTVWIICTRAYTLVVQLISRIFDTSCPALAEMIVRGEKVQLWRRFKAIVTVSGSAGVAAGVVFAVCNQPFVAVWTGGKAGWSVVNDTLLAISLVFFVSARCHVGLVGQTKQFGFLRYIHLVEGLFFVAVSLSIIRVTGIAGMLTVSIVSTLLFSFPYGTWRTARYFDESWGDLTWGWFRPMLQLAALLIPGACIIAWATQGLAPLPRLVVCFMGTVAMAGGGFLCWGIEPDTRREVLGRSLKWIRQR